jgi:hypothetical protein
MPASSLLTYKHAYTCMHVNKTSQSRVHYSFEFTRLSTCEYPCTCMHLKIPGQTPIFVHARARGACTHNKCCQSASVRRNPSITSSIKVCRLPVSYMYIYIYIYIRIHTCIFEICICILCIYMCVCLIYTYIYIYIYICIMYMYIHMYVTHIQYIYIYIYIYIWGSEHYRLLFLWQNP